MTSVCILTTVHDPLNTRVYHKEAKSLAKVGFDVTLVAHDAPEEKENGVNFRSIGSANSRLERWTHIPLAYQVAKDIDADVFHFHDPELLPIGVLLARDEGSLVIYDSHEDYGHNAINHREWIPSVARPVIADVFPRIQFALANHLDAVITPLESIGQQFRDHGHDCVETIHNYPRTDDVIIGDCPIDRQHEHQLVYVGGLEEIHGLMPMLRLIDQLVTDGIDVGIWLLGTFGSDNNKRKAEAFVRQKNLENHVQFLGFVPHEEVFAYLHESDIGLSLHNKDRGEYALPTKIFEYMYSETPVVATDAKGVRPYIDESVGQLVPHQDVREQAKTVRDLLSDPERYEKMGTNARKLVDQKYNWDNEARKLVSLYESLTRSSAPQNSY